MPKGLSLWQMHPGSEAQHVQTCSSGLLVKSSTMPSAIHGVAEAHEMVQLRLVYVELRSFVISGRALTTWVVGSLRQQDTDAFVMFWFFHLRASSSGHRASVLGTNKTLGTTQGSGHKYLLYLQTLFWCLESMTVGNRGTILKVLASLLSTKLLFSDPRADTWASKPPFYHLLSHTLPWHHFYGNWQAISSNW